MDKSNLKESNVMENKRRLFEEFKEVFQLVNLFLAANRIRFSWDSKRRDGSRVLARLDRSYLFIAPSSIISGANYKIFSDRVHLDHLPI